MKKTNDIKDFWKHNSKKFKPSQLSRYIEKKAPKHIQKFIALGGGPKLGSICEHFARHRFPSLSKRNKGRNETGYDHILNIKDHELFIEQKSSGHWGDSDDFRWQHIETNHKWNLLLLCGIGFSSVQFWAIDRTSFEELVCSGKITNQGNKNSDSSEGMWCYYSDIKHALVEINTDSDLLLKGTSSIGI